MCDHVRVVSIRGWVSVYIVGEHKARTKVSAPNSFSFALQAKAPFYHLFEKMADTLFGLCTTPLRSVALRVVGLGEAKGATQHEDFRKVRSESRWRTGSGNGSQKVRYDPSYLVYNLFTALPGTRESSCLTWGVLHERSYILTEARKTSSVRKSERWGVSRRPTRVFPFETLDNIMYKNYP